jgi:hypothetical protein
MCAFILIRAHKLIDTLQHNCRHRENSGAELSQSAQRRVAVPLELELAVVAATNLARDMECVDKMRKVWIPSRVYVYLHA